MKRLQFIIPIVPRPKGRPRSALVNGTIRMFTPHETAEYERLVALYAKQAVAQDREWPLDAPMAVEVFLTALGATVTITTLPGRKRRLRGDLDNYVKAVTDGMNGITYKDDRQIAKLTVEEEP